MRLATAVISCAIVTAMHIPVRADVISLQPVKDNTLYEDAAGARSNGAGIYFFSGLTGQPELRRGLLAFDIAGAIPSGSTIAHVSLQLHMSRTVSGEFDFSLHRTLQDWVEGASDAPLEEGNGAPAEPGDATWLHTFFDTDFWNLPGGDFRSNPRATTPVDGLGFYEWTGARMVADVQRWLDNPNRNFGWTFIGNEVEMFSAKRFDTRENPEPTFRPILTITYFTTSGVTVNPESFAVTRGAFESGGLADLFTSDDNRVVIRERRATDISASSVEIEVTGTSTTETPAGLLFTAEAFTTGFPTDQVIDLFNYQSGFWERVDQRPAPLSDRIVVVVVTNNAARFVQPGTRQIKARVGYLDLDVTFIGWGGLFDQTVWTVFP